MIVQFLGNFYLTYFFKVSGWRRRRGRKERFSEWNNPDRLSDGRFAGAVSIKHDGVTAAIRARDVGKWYKMHIDIVYGAPVGWDSLGHA